MTERLPRIESSIDTALRKIFMTYPHSQGNMEIQRAIFHLMIAGGEMPAVFGEHDYLDMVDRLSLMTSKYTSSKPHKRISPDNILNDAHEVIKNLRDAADRAKSGPPAPSEISSHKIRALDWIIKADSKYQSWYYLSRRPNRDSSAPGDNLWNDASFSFIVTYGIKQKPSGSPAIDSIYTHLPIFAKDPERNQKLQKFLRQYNKRHRHAPVSYNPQDFLANLG